MTLAERLSRISPFRWRLEWAVLLAAATAGVLAEQAREAKSRDPYEIVQAGRPARAIVSNVRIEIVALAPRRGVVQQEARTLVDLEWQDDTGAARRIAGYRLDPPTALALRIDVAAERWPSRVQILHLDRPGPAAGVSGKLVSALEQGVTASAFQQHCRPIAHCRVVVLAPDVLTPAEEAAQNVDYVLERAPHAFVLSLLLLVALLGLRFAGFVHNRPSLE